jgi:membrane-anchored glycerophosphoryl diester phosphodiesterase (GDPDase)
MPKNLSSSGQTGPLSVGNVVSASVRIYRDNFKLYFGLALVASLWLLIPIYGWAKYFAISALISRLALGEVREKPETVSDTRGQVNPRMWRFFWARILTFLIYIGVYVAATVAVTIALAIGLYVAATIAATILGGRAAAIFGQNYVIISALVGVGTLIAFLIIYIRIISRLLIVELPLAIENNIGATSAIGRSWELSKESVGRILWIFIVAFLVSLPLGIVGQILTGIVRRVVFSGLFVKSGLFYLVYYLLI